jgi:hypothetical protein
VWIYDAADITAARCAASATTSLDFAFTVHSTWVPEIRPSPRDYHVSTAVDLDLEFIRHRTFGQISFWSTFSSAVTAALQHDVVAQLLADDVLPFFDR